MGGPPANSAPSRANWTDYAIKVHALKSTSLTIGAEVLRLAAGHRGLNRGFGWVGVLNQDLSRLRF